jgi:uncharacterized RDD family membrane protein YckC
MPVIFFRIPFDSAFMRPFSGSQLIDMSGYTILVEIEKLVSFESFTLRQAQGERRYPFSRSW